MTYVHPRIILAQEMRPVIDAFVEALPGTWSMDWPEEAFGPRLIDASNPMRTLWVNVDKVSGEARVEVSSGLDVPTQRWASSNLYPYFEPFKTTFALDRMGKAPVACANQVQRRVLLPAETEWLRVSEAQRRAADYDSAQRDNLASLGLPVVNRHHSQDLESNPSVRFGEVYGSVQVHASSVTLDLHGLSVEQARKVLDLLRD